MLDPAGCQSVDSCQGSDFFGAVWAPYTDTEQPYSSSRQMYAL